MRFYVVKNQYNLEKNEENIYLVEDKWNDWFTYSTQFYLVTYDKSNQLIEIGSVKIGQVGMKEKSPAIPTSFEKLDVKFFSLGQDVKYYENLQKIDDRKMQEIFLSLNDMAYNPEIYLLNKNETVVSKSLLRDVTEEEILGQFYRVAHGGVTLTEYNFTYTSAPINGVEPVKLSFSVKPESMPPTNIHVLIGRNGVGKTRLLSNMSKTLIYDNDKYGMFNSNDKRSSQKSNIFANVVFVSFSAFDECHEVSDFEEKKYSYIGLSYKKNIAVLKKSLFTKSPQKLEIEFEESIKKCQSKRKQERWKAAIGILQSDPIFAESEINYIFDQEDDLSKAKTIFHRLSTGHKIVLLTITKLIEKVEERTIVFMDEPETYLHPPLVASFIRALSDLLVYRNGVCIIATHSPVILQEVPKQCVWKLRRNGKYLNAERMEIESFGENIGILISDVFQLEVTNSGFHSLLSEQVKKANTYQEVEDIFDNQLGVEAKAIIRCLFLEKGKR